MKQLLIQLFYLSQMRIMLTKKVSLLEKTISFLIKKTTKVFIFKKNGIIETIVLLLTLKQVLKKIDYSIKLRKIVVTLKIS